MGPWTTRAFQSVLNEWREAPWFVILAIAVAALVGPGIVWAAWTAIGNLL